MSPGKELATLVCCDLGAIVRGRSLPAEELGAALAAGVGWVPANHALTPLGPLAAGAPFGSTGDLRLLPDPSTRMRLQDEGSPAGALELLLCDIVETDGRPWEACPRCLLRTTLEELERELGASVQASFEHEFQLLLDAPAELPFSLREQRLVAPFGELLMAALEEAGLGPERFFAEYAPHQFEVPLAPADAIGAADRAVLLREVVHEVARRRGLRATFVPLLDPEHAGNGVHIHLQLRDGDGEPLLHDPAGPAGLSELGLRFAAGVLAHARALSVLTASSPVSALRLQPHRWSAGAVTLAERNREALLRVPPYVALGGGERGEQQRLEYRGADASANPHLALAAILRAGLEGVRERLPAPPLLEGDPAALQGEEAARHGVGGLPGSLEQALEALTEDALLHGWLPPLLRDTFLAIKRSELEALSGMQPAEVCERYAGVY